MLNYKLGDTTFTIPASLKEATVRQFMQFREHGKKHDLIMSLSIFSGLPYETWSDAELKYIDIERVVAALDWVQDFDMLKTMPLPSVYHVGGKEFVVPSNLELKTLGQRVAFENEIFPCMTRTGDLMEVLDRAVAIYFYPELTGSKYDTDKLGDVLEAVRDSPISEAYPIARFFLKKYFDSREKKAKSLAETLTQKRSKPAWKIWHRLGLST